MNCQGCLLVTRRNEMFGRRRARSIKSYLEWDQKDMDADRQPMSLSAASTGSYGQNSRVQQLVEEV